MGGSGSPPHRFAVWANGVVPGGAGHERPAACPGFRGLRHLRRYDAPARQTARRMSQNGDHVHSAAAQDLRDWAAMGNGLRVPVNQGPVFLRLLPGPHTDGHRRVRVRPGHADLAECSQPG